MSCEESSPDDIMSCDDDDRNELGHNLATQLELQIPHILDNTKHIGKHETQPCRPARAADTSHTGQH